VPQESDLLLGETRLAIVVAGIRRHGFQEDCMERKAIQIVAYPDHLYALCDDGAIWSVPIRRKTDADLLNCATTLLSASDWRRQPALQNTRFFYRIGRKMAYAGRARSL
jgi:hypothetical protein